MNDRHLCTLRELLDTRPTAERAAQAAEALPERTRGEARALAALGRLAETLPRHAPSPDFVERTMRRVRARPAPRPSVWTWLRSPRLSPLGALAGATAAALAAFALAWSFAPGSTTVAPGAAPERIVRLVLAAPAAHAVSLAGDFNGWRPEATPLHRRTDGVWVVDLPLAAGRRYQYMFVVDGEWITDPAAPAHVDDGFGGRNAILDV
jgi:hypothetical protein